MADADVRLANESWETLLQAQAALLRGFAAERMWDELSIKEYDVLYTLKKAGCAKRLSDLHGAVLLSQPALSRLVDRLESRGLVRRAPDPQDKRGVLIALTPEGAELQSRIGARHARSVERRMRAALAPDEMRTLQTFCTRLAAAQRALLPETRGTAAEQELPS
ncbi:MarR family transcriptional regulator [Amnibacterium sp. CER49]|uniref:MarR family winged helix-turn-helix transcriptional regulator n=1 Tax=Amnibacterium sp. CER49 TaxID=3039161 RepID=UPI00244C3A80|nr:MarR family transcriptional regulator [Amnibacterium sp. CER49]MDH2443474.1 MarR family transcriptional regulator [Amnibacterium sp. CER49]